MAAPLDRKLITLGAQSKCSFSGGPPLKMVQHALQIMQGKHSATPRCCVLFIAAHTHSQRMYTCTRPVKGEEQFSLITHTLRTPCKACCEAHTAAMKAAHTAQVKHSQSTAKAVTVLQDFVSRCMSPQLAFHTPAQHLATHNVHRESLAPMVQRRA